MTGVILGAGAMYLLDPDRGARRRSLLRDQGVHVGHKLTDGLAVTARDTRNRSAGSGQTREHAPELMQENLAPATRLAVGTVGGLLAIRGTRKGGVSGQLLSVLGFGLLARAAGNLPARSLVGLGAGRRAVEVEKTLLVRAPVDRVWELWSNFENFPKFMAHLQEVRKVDEGRSHWVALGPAGVPVEWDAAVTDWVPRQFIGWTSVEGSTVETSGQVRFRPVSGQETEIDVQLSYNPPAGAAGHALASVLGIDPKRAMDEDLVRLKSLLEDEKTSTSEGSVHLEEATGGGKSRTRPGQARSRKKP
jgi:uncharacterized membrane protein